MALQRLFLQMQTSRSPIGTTDLTNSFGWSEHDSFIQHDIHELTRVLLDNLEEKLNAAQRSSDGNGSLTSSLTQKNAIQHLFRGTMENFIEVKDVTTVVRDRSTSTTFNSSSKAAGRSLTALPCY